MKIPEAPKRKFFLDLKIGADSLEQLKLALEEISFSLSETDADIAHGSPSWGGSWFQRVNHSMTPELYKFQLEEYLKTIEAANAADK